MSDEKGRRARFSYHSSLITYHYFFFCALSRQTPSMMSG